MPAHRMRARRGTVYLIVLISVVLLVVIGLSGLYAAHVQSRVVSAGSDAEQARFNAHAAIELGATMIQENPNWRNKFGGGTWVNDMGLGEGTVTIEVRDPDDADVIDSNLDPIVLRGVGGQAECRQMMEIRLDAVPSGVNSLQSAAHAGRIMAFDGANVDADAPLSSNGSTWASTASVNADVESAGTIFGAAFNGSLSPNGSELQMPLPAEVISTYSAGATPITMTEIAQVSSNVLLNESFDYVLTQWSPSNCALAHATSGSQEGPGHVRVASRANADAGPMQQLATALVKGATYDISAWAKSGSGTIRVQLSLIIETEDGPAWVRGPDANVGTSWASVSGTIVPTWGAGKTLQRAYMVVHTTSGTTNFELDKVMLRPQVLAAPVIEDVVLSSTSNPYGAGTKSATGTYVIDCADAPLIIRNCRIEGTLILLNAGAGTAVEESVVIDTSASAPSLIVDGSITLRTTQDDLVEADQYLSFNPTGTPFGGSADVDVSDSYACLIGGIVYVTTDAFVEQRTSVDGVLMADRDIIFRGDQVELTHRPTYASAPPNAFWGPSKMVIDRRSWTKVVD